MSETEVTTSEESVAKNSANFRRVFMDAARTARANRKISMVQFMTIAMVSRNPRMMDRLQETIEELAITEGRLATSDTKAIDWDSLLKFIQGIDWIALMQFIMQLIALG